MENRYHRYLKRCIL